MPIRERPPGMKTYSHLAGQGRVPTQYELVSTGLLYHPTMGFAVDTPAARWYAQHTKGSQLSLPDWEGFSDPSAMTYTTYVEARSREEESLTQAKRLMAERRAPIVGDALERRILYAFTLRHPLHGLQMCAAYVAQMAPTGKLVITAMMQAADELRRIQILSYGLGLVQKAAPTLDSDTRRRWEKAPLWQPLRELVEQLLVTYDWGEALVALNLCVKPFVDAYLVHALPRADGHDGTSANDLVWQGLRDDIDLHRRWTTALVQYAIAGRAENRDVIEGWVARWWPRAERALAALDRELPIDAIRAEMAAEPRRFLDTMALSPPVSA